MNSPPRKIPGRRISQSWRCVVLELIVISTLNGVLFGMLLFLMASGLTSSSACWASSISRMRASTCSARSSASRSAAGSASGRAADRALLAGAIGAGVERYGLRACTATATCGAFVHLRPGVRDRGSGADHLARARGFPRSLAAGFPRFTIFSTNYPPTRCSCCWCRSRSSSASCSC